MSGLINAHDFTPTVVSVSGSLLMDTYYVCTAAGTTTQTLPATSGSGKVIIIENLGAGTITLSGTGSDTINGVTSLTLAPYGVIKIRDYAVGTWYIQTGNVAAYFLNVIPCTSAGSLAITGQLTTTTGTDSSSISTGDLVVAGGTAVKKNLYVGTGVVVAASQDKLSNYTNWVAWDPTFINRTGGPITNYSAQTYTWNRIGNMVTVQVYYTSIACLVSMTCKITLPVTSVNTLVVAGNVYTGSVYTPVSIYLAAGSTQANVHYTFAPGTGYEFGCSFSYQV